MVEFVGFPKVARLSREVVITEKIDGTNAQVYIRPASDGAFEFGLDTQVEINGERHCVRAGSRNRWLTIGGNGDNYGFGSWVSQHAHELAALGPGRHFGEWWGCGIQRGYGIKEKRFSLFNTARWCYGFPTEGQAVVPECCNVVPILYTGPFSTPEVERAIISLAAYGSRAAPGFMNPEGIMLYHTAANIVLKKTIKDDASPKSKVVA